MHTWCLVAAARQSPGPRAVHSRTASRMGVSWLGWCTPGVLSLPYGRAWAAEPSIAARRHGWGYPGWGTARSQCILKKNRLLVTHVTVGTKRGHVVSWPGGRRRALILPGSPCVAHCFPSPPLLVATARCPSSAVCPARDTAVSPSLATGVFLLAPRSHDHQGDSRGLGGRGGGGGSGRGDFKVQCRVPTTRNGAPCKSKGPGEPPNYFAMVVHQGIF